MASGGRSSGRWCANSSTAATSNTALPASAALGVARNSWSRIPCRGRCFCPSCHEKRALEKAGWVGEHVCAEVPHRQFVFTIPKRLRICFRFERRQVYASDPICCPKCGAEMKIIAFIERHQTEVIEKILRHCGLWDDASARAPPAAERSVKG